LCGHRLAQLVAAFHNHKPKSCPLIHCTDLQENGMGEVFA
jgi:hypothetical protein